MNTQTGSGVLDVIVMIVLVALGVAMALAAIRLFLGPTLPDRVVALDLLGLFAAGAICVTAIQTQRPALLVVAIVMALLLFLGTAAFAQYLERRARP